MATEAGRRVVLSVLALTAVSFLISAAVFTLVLLAAGARGALDPETRTHLLQGLVGGLLVTAVAFLLLPAIGRLARFGDEVRMLELCDPGAPLLRQLLELAPGTYHHSIIVGSMAEAAAHEIGADALLARVGAYYHDIGKGVRPRFFTENQLGMRNPHDDAQPQQSAMIITAHVREGVEMASRARLPRPVIDIIAQSHGTSLVACFYGKAVEQSEQVDEAPFRYEESVPQSREAALVMLADSSEAAVRALTDTGSAQIEDAVRRVIRCKQEDGQLARSGMSVDDVEKTVAVYSRMLASQRHRRVEYPDTAERA
jgi:putative nucleotidyltransferase with HDIG domain